jgi:predicted ArsR family transcriptional regulator
VASVSITHGLPVRTVADGGAVALLIETPGEWKDPTLRTARRYYDVSVKNTHDGGGLARGRAAVLAALLDQPDPVGIDALAQATARHPNTVREQVNWLVAHGHVRRIRQPQDGRGRPAWLYEARGGRPDDDDYVELAAALAWRLQEATPDVRDEAIAAGRRWGSDLVARKGVVDRPSPEAARRWTVELLDELGYQPHADEGDREVVLHRCPLLQAAHRFPDVVCAVHLGMVQSALEGNGSTSEGTALTPFSAPGECRLRLAQPANASS